MSRYFDLLKNLLISNSSGQQKPLSDLKPDYLGIYFTAPWCSACNVFKPHLDRIYQISKQTNKTMQIVTYSLDNTPQYLSDLTQSNNYWTFKQVDSGNFNNILMQLRIMHIPKFVVFNREGKVITNTGVQDIYKHKNNVFEFWERFYN